MFRLGDVLLMRKVRYARRSLGYSLIASELIRALFFVEPLALLRV